MGSKADKIIGGFCAIAQAGLLAASTAIKPIPIWIPIVMATVGAATAVVKVGWFGGDS
jgi:hypothetical protein